MLVAISEVIVGDLGAPLLVAIFLVGALATWMAGIVLSRATDSLDDRLKLGDAFGGVILLAVSGSLPELAITVAAVMQGNLDIAAGNLIGGIAVQTMVLVLCDRAVGGDHPLSYLVGSLIPVLEGALVVVLVAVMLMGTMLPPSAAVAGVSPASIGIVVAWLIGIYLIGRVRRTEPWQVAMPGSQPGRRHRRLPHPMAKHPFARMSTLAVGLIFLAASAVTLVAGVALEATGSALADQAGINGVVFGATILAAATALPEISTGLEAVRLGDHQLAMGDIFGGNAFQLCLFVLADLLAGTPLLPHAGAANAWLGALGIVLTGIYIGTIIVRLERRHAGLGADSILAVLVFAVGMWGLQIVAAGGP
ncbi:MAG TPA: sodium:calcium antiporter [Candidatus Dormibacteraeota bacterium]|nr:sodium:calcium antiporter [Candidatus Dormibacteraeota bacterium]